jgi:hypothetical protein
MFSNFKLKPTNRKPTLIIKPIDSVDACALMVTPEEEKVFWVFDFVGQE